MFKPGQGIRLRGSARTNTGKVRDNNEDNVHLWIGNPQTLLAVVADGMGGAVAGEEASRIAIESIQSGMSENGITAPEQYYAMQQEALVNHLIEAIRNANLNIVHQARQFPELKGMGTTVTLAMVIENSVVVGHVGDSRAYLIHGDSGHIEQITSDHSFVQALVSAGHISEEEAEDHPMKNVLYRALGQATDIEIDIYYEQLHAGDHLVLCSDGLTLHVKPQEIAEIALHDDPDLSSQQLIDLANKRGGRDNVSVIVIKAENDPDHMPAYNDEETLEIVEPGFLDDDDTLIIRGEAGGFGSSESSNTLEEAPDTNIKHLKAANGQSKTSTSTHATVKVFTPARPHHHAFDYDYDDHQDDQDDHHASKGKSPYTAQENRTPKGGAEDGSESFGEGRDPLIRDS